MNIRKLLSFVGGLTLLFSASQSQAIVINVDPGAIGDSYSGTTVNIPGPNAENVTVLFNDNKYIELGLQSAQFNQVSWGGPVGGGNYFADMEFGFLDELGNVILSQVLSNDIIATSFHGRNLNITTALVAYGMFFNTSPIGPLDANARIEFNLNGVVGSVPEPATLALFAFGLAGLGFRKMKLR